MRLHWLILSCLSVFLFSSPVQAGKLLFWRFDSNRNQLIFTTDEDVQPTAQLIANPTRLVIDLPNTTLGSSTVNRSVGEKITSVRAGQFNSQTARIVVELAPGYTIDPKQVRFQGISSTRWFVNLPKPEKTSLLLPSSLRDKPSSDRLPTRPSPQTLSLPSSRPNKPSSDRAPTSLSSRTARSQTQSPSLEVRKKDIFVGIDGNKSNKIIAKRSADRRQINFYLEGIELPANLKSRSIAVNRHQVEAIQFSQDSTSPAIARLTLNVSENSPNWGGYFSRLGGLVLMPKGGAISTETQRNSSRRITSRSTTSSTSKLPLVSSLELVNSNSRQPQLLIKSEQQLKAQGSWNSRLGVYEIKIVNARLADRFQGPRLTKDSPISQLRVRQKDGRTVEIIVKPSLGVRVGQLERTNNQLLALEMRQLVPASLIDRPFTPSYPSSSRISNYPRSRLPNQKVVVVIDPGHGGKDPGTIGIGGVREKDIVLPISKRVSKFLEQAGVKVIMTRTSDYFVSLGGRTDMANRAGADIFVSIHANAINLSRPDVNGLETYYYNSGRNLANTIHKNILRSVNIDDRGMRRARFYVLRKSSMPAVLVEVGFLTGRDDAVKLKNPRYREQMSRSIANGILQYIRQTRR